MKSFFDPCVNKIVKLIDGQAKQIDRLNAHTKTIVLIGGFGESQYLQEEIESAFLGHNIELRSLGTPWSAICRGAVLCGAEERTTKSSARAISCRRNYGILSPNFSNVDEHVINSTMRLLHEPDDTGYHITWLLKKGDAIFSNGPLIVEQTLPVIFQANQGNCGQVSIYSYDDDDWAIKSRSTSKGLVLAATINYNLLLSSLRKSEQVQDQIGMDHDKVVLTLKLTLHGERLEGTLFYYGSAVSEPTNIMY